MHKRLIKLFVILLTLTVGGITNSADLLTIDDAVKLAFKTHPQAVIAESTVAEARGLRRKATALEPPNFSIRWDNIPTGQRISDYEERRVGISQEFDFPLLYFWRAKIADCAIDRAKYEKWMLLADLESDVRKAYLEAWSLSEQERIYLEFCDTFKVYAQRIKAMGDKGEYSPIIVQDYNNGALRAEVEYKTVQRRVIAAREKLSSLIGYQTDDFNLISPFESNPIDINSYSDSIVKSNPPQLLASKANLQASEYNQKLAQNAWLPQFQVNYFKRFETDPRRNDNWALELEMTLPIWFWWGGLGAMREAEAKTSRIRAEYEITQLKFHSERIRLVQEIVSGYEQYQLYQTELIPSTQHKVQFTRQNVALGGANFIDFLKEWKKYKDILIEDVEVKFKLYTDIIALEELLGVIDLGTNE